MRIIAVTNGEGAVAEPIWLARAESVHRQLRPQIPDPYPESIVRVFAGGGRMRLAVTDDAVAGIAIFRIYENTSQGRKLYVDDLIVDAEHRSRGVGHALLTHLEHEARRAGCAVLDLDSGTHRERAHRFYFRAGYTIRTFGFTKTL